MAETVTLTVKISTTNDYDGTIAHEETIEQAPFESTDAFFSRAQAMLAELKEKARR